MDLLRRLRSKNRSLGSGSGSLLRASSYRQGPSLQQSGRSKQTISFLASSKKNRPNSSQPSRRRQQLAWLSTETPGGDDKLAEIKSEDPLDGDLMEETSALSANSEHAVLEEKTLKLLNEKEHPIGSMDWGTFSQARELIYQWANQGDSRTPHTVDRSFQLLDRLVQEQSLNFNAQLTEQTVAKILDSSVLGTVVKSWSICYQKHNDDTMMLSPQGMLEKLDDMEDKYPNGSKFKEVMQPILVASVSRVETLPDAEYVESILTKMMDEFLGGNRRMAPTIGQYNSVLHAFAKAQAADRAEKLLDRLLDHYVTGVSSSALRPDDVSFGTVLYAWKRSAAEEAGERAEACMQKMKDFGEMEKDPSLQHPGAKCYTSVLQAWCNPPRTRRRLEQAECFLERMHEEYKAGNEEARPTAESYGIMIHSWAQEGCSEDSERMLRMMHNDFVQNGNTKARPTAYHFNPVISSWSKRGDQDSLARAFSLFESMNSMDVHPDSATFGALTYGLSHSKSARAAEQADRLLQEQLWRFREGDMTCRPDAMTFNATMHSWAAVGNTKKVLKLLFELVEHHKKYTSIITDDRPFCTALAAVARSQYPDKTTIAESIFEEIRNMFKEGALHFQPSARCYGALMACWASAERPESGERCLELLHGMRERDAAGEEALAPTEAHYKTTIDSFARIGNPQKAEDVWVEMLQSSLKGGAKPGSESCKAVLCSWLMTGSSQGVKRVLGLMDQIADIDRTGTIDLKLSKDAYYLLFDLCVKSKSDDVLAGAEEILRKMKEIHAEGRGAMAPDVRCYNIVINCLGRLRRAERAEAMLWEMYNEFIQAENQGAQPQPDAFTISTVLTAWSRSESESAARRAEVFFERTAKMIAKGQLPSVKLDTVCYASLLNCLANAKTEEATERAEELFAGMQQHQTSADIDIRPSIECYHALVRCRVAMGNLVGAENLVYDLLENFKRGERHLEPTYKVCSRVIAGWLSSPDADAPVKALEFLIWMNRNLNERNQPDALVHASVLRLWARSRRSDSGFQTENIMMDMAQKFGPRRPIVVGCFSDVVCAWARSGNLKRAEHLLSRLCSDYKSDLTATHPEERAFVAVLAEMSRTQPSNVGMRCLSVIQSCRDVRELASKKNNRAASPSKVLECWSSGSNDKDGLQAFLKQMEEFDKPSQVAGASTDDNEEDSEETPSLAFKY